MKTEPNMPKYIASEAALAAAKARLRKNRIGSIGAGARSSQAMKAASAAIPVTLVLSTSTLIHPAALPRTSAHTMPSRPALATARPGRSSRLFGP
jgi:hypothetical protein